MQDFPANSQKAKARSEEPLKIDRVTSAEAVRPKRGLGRQFKETFIGGSARMALEYMTMEVIVPAIQDTMLDALQGGLERLIRGESRPRKPMTTATYSNVGRFNYQGISTGGGRPSSPPRSLSRASRERHDFREIVIPNRREAEEVIDRLFDILNRYDSVTVANLYALTGIDSSHTDHKWGWTNLRGARAVPARRAGGFLLDLPSPEPLG